MAAEMSSTSPRRALVYAYVLEAVLAAEGVERPREFLRAGDAAYDLAYLIPVVDDVLRSKPARQSSSLALNMPGARGPNFSFTQASSRGL